MFSLCLRGKYKTNKCNPYPAGEKTTAYVVKCHKSIVNAEHSPFLFLNLILFLIQEMQIGPNSVLSYKGGGNQWPLHQKLKAEFVPERAIFHVSYVRFSDLRFGQTLVLINLYQVL